MASEWTWEKEEPWGEKTKLIRMRKKKLMSIKIGGGGVRNEGRSNDTKKGEGKKEVLEETDEES